MQTFLPYADFAQTAKCLDMKRLGKQRVEAWQIFLSLTITEYGWKNHPAVKMWKGYEHALCLYGMEICNEWKDRGYKDSLYPKFYEKFVFYNALLRIDVVKPLWFGNDKFHLSHKSNLIRKLPEHYGKLWPETPNDLPYFWPS